jgi:uncharacterized protein (TIGR03435 family)
LTPLISGKIRVLLLVGMVADATSPGTAAQPPQGFEVVSIKRNMVDGDRPMRTTLTASRFAYPNTTVIGLIRTAFGVKSFQISEGWPGWLRTERYDIDAKIDGIEVIGIAQLRPMLQELLADRFKLKVRREMKEFPVYALVVAKNGPKIKENSGADGLPQQITGDSGMSRMTCIKVSMTYFANALESQFENQFGRKIVDDTGLKGNYDIAVSWSGDQSAESPGPSIFTSLQEQLGLKLESQRGNVETIHIDSIERPSEN